MSPKNRYTSYIQAPERILKVLGVKMIRNDAPNAETLGAINELKAGKGKKFKSVEDLFNSI